MMLMWWGVLNDAKQDSGDGSKSLLGGGSPFAFYLLTYDCRRAPSDLKTHISVNKVSRGAF